MNMNQFRNYLKEVNGKLLNPQSSAMYEDKKESGKTLEETISSLSNTTPANVDISTNINENKELLPDKGVKGREAAKKLYNNEDVVKEYLEGFFDGELSEDTSDEDIMEAVDNIVILSAMIESYLEEDESSEEIEDAVSEYVSNYFGDELTEDTTDEELLESINELFSVYEAVCDYFELDENMLRNIGSAIKKGATHPVTKKIASRSGRIGKGALGVGLDTVKAGMDSARARTGV